MNVFQTLMNRRRFLKTGAAAGATGAAVTGLGGLPGLTPVKEAKAQAAAGQTTITKNICHQCPARCGIDVYTTDGRVHAIYGNTDHPIANGKLCPKGHLGTYILYDQDRWKGPMKRTNPKKGRNEDPGFVPISWDEALDTIAGRLQNLRDKGESHRFALFYGRGWGASCAGLQGPFGKLYGSPNVAIGHASMCSEGSKRAKKATDGNDSYNAYDYRNTNYLLIFGAGFLEAFRPYNYLMQMWGHMRTKSPKTRVTTIDVHANTTTAASDRALYIKPGTDGALALAIAHVMLTEGLWDKEFVGDFRYPGSRFRSGERIPAGSFAEKWTHGIEQWWNEELKDRTPEWAETITTIPARHIRTVAREFGSTRPAMAIFERGPTAHTNGTYNGMAIHALNALTGALFAEGGLHYQMGPSYGSLPVNADDYMDDWSRDGAWKKQPRIDMAGTERWPTAGTMMQEAGPNHLKGDPYKLDTAMFYLTNPILTAPNGQVWEEAMKDVFIIDTSPYGAETAAYADIIVPDHTYLERLQDAPTYPFEGWPMAQLRTPAIEPVHDTKVYGDVLIEIGKRMKGPMGDYYKALGSTENVLRHLATGFAKDPGDNGVNSFETWKEKGVWYKKPYHWRQWRGDFYEWDGKGYNVRMSEEDVKAKLLKTPSGKFEFNSGFIANHAENFSKKLGVPANRIGLIQWVPPKYTGGGDLHLVTPKTAMHAEGRGANLSHAIALQQPMHGGNRTVFLEIHPQTARDRGIRNGDKVRIKSSVGSIEAYCKFFEGTRPDTLVLPFEHGHWSMLTRWTQNRGVGHSGEVTENVSDPISGLACYYTGMVSVERA
ncbi:MAG TPA: molybdopterin-dependent oxidoreductase [Rhodocyclaceae bacterium]|nr:molybdopterin-dependent oxidoreductase [Rhodocyclaceae bacterium]HRQ45446.1 molybdopterin-dependent oxidoreductase [Rhodocyclaceae bacterium]